MTIYAITNPFEIFTDTDGTPLEAGYIYIGEANNNPITNPIDVTWDANGLYPAAQPIRTINGYPSRNGSPSNIFISTENGVNEYSIIVQNNKQEIALYERNKKIEEGTLKTATSFGAVGDGITDDYPALQAALNSNQLIILPKGRYRITQELVIDPVVNRNSGFIGLTSWSNYPSTSQTGGPTWLGDQEVVIFYDGPLSATACVIRASAEAVGVQVDQTFDNTIYGFRLESVLLDGNDLAGFGLYGIRLSEPEVVNTCVRGTNKHGYYIDGTFSGRFEKVSAVFNNGCGMTFGRAELDYSWSAGTKINAVYFSDLYASTNGADKTFDESTNPLWGYGIGMWLHRGNIISSYTSELNDGVAVVFAPTFGPNVIQCGYSELSSQYVVSGTTAIADGRATRGWAVWFVGYTGGTSLCISIENVFSASEGIRLTGVEPSTGRIQECLKFKNIKGANYLNADWSNYCLVSCTNELIAGITGSSPTGVELFSGGIRFDTTGSTLNAYEEGTFSPQIEGSTVAGTGWTYSVNVGAYTKIGQHVFITGRITITAIGSGASGAVRLTNLPYTVRNANNYYSGASISNVANLNTSVVHLSAYAFINTTYLNLLKMTAAATSESSLLITDLTNTTSFVFSCHYIV